MAWLPEPRLCESYEGEAGIKALRQASSSHNPNFRRSQ